MPTINERLATLEAKVEAIEKAMVGSRAWIWWVVGTLIQTGILLAAVMRR